MKWLQSTSNMSYTANGKVIPSIKGEPVQVSNEEAERITKNAAIASLLKNGAIKVLDTYTSANATADDTKLQALTTENAQLADKVRELEAKLAEAPAVAAPAPSAEVEELKAKIAEWESKYAALEQEAKDTIADLQGKLEKTSKKKKDE